jgi:hypothetical protein
MTDSLAENQEEVKHAKKTPFQSPVPVLIKLRNLIYGKGRPDIYTQITYYINLLIWMSFMFWNVISYFAITSRHMIYQQKGISLTAIVERRGKELNFEPGTFLDRLYTFHAISIICWGLVFIGLVLLYRKKKQFIYFTLGPVIFYLGMTMFYLSFTYFAEDTTAYDKVALLIFIASISIHSYLMKNEREGGTISFFGESAQEADDQQDVE